MTPWKPHTETPASEPCPAIIAVPAERDDDVLEPGPLLLSSIHVWQRGEWADESTGRALRFTTFWWCAEVELIDHLKALVRAQENGHA